MTSAVQMNGQDLLPVSDACTMGERVHPRTLKKRGPAPNLSRLILFIWDYFASQLILCRTDSFENRCENKERTFM